MSHPNWALLVSDRDAGGEEPAGWASALDHMDGCDTCRKQALAADPTLVFRRLPTVTADAAEVDSMRRAVASLRQASRTLDRTETAPPRRTPAAGAGESARRLAAALVLAAAGLGVWFAAGQGEEPAAVTTHPVAAAAPAVAASLPVFEELSRPHEPNVYQMGGDDLTVVMVVDETLDI